ncbi:MAG: IS1595 family transposase [Deltaproteobacteria bacterium]|nr:IS1595 family transposase [Deltaproteobacteria bacterium]
MESKYKRMKGQEFFDQIKTEAQAREWVWKARFDGKDFVCPRCHSESFYQYHQDPEIRKCQECYHRVRLRTKTIFQNSNLPLLIWIRGIYWATQGKRGISALELKRQLSMRSYGTTWAMLHKIRRSLQERDDQYKLKDLIELDGAKFGKRESENQVGVLVGVETKDWIDEQGRSKSKAGFAKVMIRPETTICAQEFVNTVVEKGTMINTDGANCYKKIEEADFQVVSHDQEVLDHWLPWVHKFISNAKTWLMGTHHRTTSKYLERYLAEYTYRFNRRHDPDSWFHRALTACVFASPRTLGTLFG